MTAAVLGVAYRYALDPPEERSWPNYGRSCLHAIGLAFSGLAVQLSLAAAARTRLGPALRRLPMAAEFAAKALAMTAVLTGVAIALQWALYPDPLPERWLTHELPLIVVIAFAVSLVIGAIIELQRLVGGHVLGSFLLGTYRRPQREQRIVMFLDIDGSTALAERMGEVRVHDLITRFFFDIDRPIAEAGGEVHAYAGDAVIVTWPLTDDPERNGRALRCFVAVADRLAELSRDYVSVFGTAPQFHAAIHAGPVVISECGDARRQIAYFGDTMNVTARLCDHCKVAGEALIASADLLRRAAIPPGLDLGPVESVALRGRTIPVAAHGVRGAAFTRGRSGG